MQQFQRPTSEAYAGRKVNKIWQHARDNFSPNKYVNFRMNQHERSQQTDTYAPEQAHCRPCMLVCMCVSVSAPNSLPHHRHNQHTSNA